MFRVAVIACVAVAVFAAPFDTKYDSEWEAFKTTHNKKYVSREEESLRYIRLSHVVAAKSRGSCKPK